MRHPKITVIALIAAVTATSPCWSQDSTRIAHTVFTNPGARSLGLGGAFAAIADDATAAFANPAGLVQILRPEISAEVRGTGRRGPSVAISPSTGASPVSGSFRSSFRLGTWAFALYSHQLGSLDFTFDGPIPQTREFNVRSYSGAAAFQVGDDLSFGAGVSYFDGNRSYGIRQGGYFGRRLGPQRGRLVEPVIGLESRGFLRQGPGFESRSAPTQLTFPDVYGLGAAFRPNAGALTIGFEWDQVGEAVDPLLSGKVVTEGGSEIHIGAEYAILRWKPVVAFRMGFWHEPSRDRQRDDRTGCCGHHDHRCPHPFRFRFRARLQAFPDRPWRRCD